LSLFVRYLFFWSEESSSEFEAPSERIKIFCTKIFFKFYKNGNFFKFEIFKNFKKTKILQI